jgi:hypothetical protein
VLRIRISSRKKTNQYPRISLYPVEIIRLCYPRTCAMFSGSLVRNLCRYPIPGHQHSVLLSKPQQKGQASPEHRKSRSLALLFQLNGGNLLRTPVHMMMPWLIRLAIFNLQLRIRRTLVLWLPRRDWWRGWPWIFEVKSRDRWVLTRHGGLRRAGWDSLGYPWMCMSPCIIFSSLILSIKRREDATTEQESLLL